MRVLPLLALCGVLCGAAACSPPESRAARQYLACVAGRDLSCLRRLSAPLVPRLHSWAAAGRADPLFVGPYARAVMLEADNPFGALLPGDCAQAGQRGALDDVQKRGLSSCGCVETARRALAPAEARRAAFEPHRLKALKTHPALEVLANRTTAEALRVTTLATLRCTCDGRTVDVGVLDLVGRDPVHRVFQVSGVCGPTAPLADGTERLARLLEGRLDAAAPPSPAAPPR